MSQSSHNQLIAFIWSIADDCLRDVYVRGKYRDVILPMLVLRRLDALLEPTKEAVLEEKQYQKDENFIDLEADGLREASGYVFYNTSRWTLKRLHSTATNSQQILQSNFEDYLNGFSDNVKEIIDKFKLKSQIEHLANKDVLLDVLEKFTSSNINLTPLDKHSPEGRKLPALTNLGMGYVFEELIRKFNEENNEEAGEHFTPREVIDLMTHIIFEPVKDKLPPVMTIYDPACGSGGMLTESEHFITDENGSIRATGDVYLYGKEINDETYAICKSDMMIKGGSPQNIRVGSTLASDEFQGTCFNFMLSNPPYGKSWSTDAKYIKDGKDIIDPRFVVKLNDYWGEEGEYPATPRSSDGQLLFLMEMVSKMKSLDDEPLGSRIASVHNGSSLFTGDAGSGESNIRRYLIEHDLLDCIIQLPNNLFYNTGITTYIWVLANNKAASRKGKVLLIDASERYVKLRKNLGAKNCELNAAHIAEIQCAYDNFVAIDRGGDDSLCAKVFNNQDFGYYKVTIDRPDRRKAQFSDTRIADLRFEKALAEPMQWAYDTYGDDVYQHNLDEQLIEWCEKNDFELTTANRKKLTNPAIWDKHKTLVDTASALMAHIGTDEFDDFNVFCEAVDSGLKTLALKLSAPDKKLILNAVSWYDESAKKVIKKKQKITGDKLNTLLARLACTVEQLPDFGYFATDKAGEFIIYETSSDLRDSESVPLNERIHDYYLREVKPHVDEAWIDLEKTKIGYEISFNKYFYQHKPLRSLAEVTADILELEKQSEGLIADILRD